MSTTTITTTTMTTSEPVGQEPLAGAALDVMAYARLFQVCDSTFPIGSFNHSFGMEN